MPSRFQTPPPASRRRPPRWRAFAILIAVLALLASACGDDSDVVIVAITRTPEVATTPTGPSTPETPTSSTATPTSGPTVILPSAPDNVFAGANLLVPYLAGGSGDVDRCLPELIDGWGLALSDGIQCVLADMDGDGGKELALLISLEREQDPPGDVWIFDDASNGQRLIGSARSFSGTVLSGVHIVTGDDLTGDGLSDIVVSTESCSAVVCSTDFLILSAHRGGFEDLGPRDIALEGSEPPTVEDVTGDGTLDLVIRGGLGASAGAGPPRTLERRIYWSGLKFFVVDETEAPQYLIHAIEDADMLFAGTDYASASERYEGVASNSSLADWRVQNGQTPGRAELAPYSIFRAGLSLLRLGNVVEARVLFERAFDQYPVSLHGVTSAVYLDSLLNDESFAQACERAEIYLRSRSASFGRIWDYGYANPEHTIEGFCR
jgi:hypothetical protein